MRLSVVLGAPWFWSRGQAFAEGVPVDLPQNVINASDFSFVPVLHPAFWLKIGRELIIVGFFNGHQKLDGHIHDFIVAEAAHIAPEKTLCCL